MYDFPFNILDILHLLNVVIKKQTPLSLQVNCPFCDDTNGKMKIKIETNQFNCPRCNNGGGMLKLYANLRQSNDDTKEAYRNILYELNINDKLSYNQPKQVKKTISIKEKILNEKEVHKTYKELLKELDLRPRHIENLMCRGFSLDEIEKYGYKSTPYNNFEKITTTLLERGCIFYDVAGFYKKDDSRNWSLNFLKNCNGIIIPIYSIDGLIQGLQIRLDNQFNKTKYLWFSSYEKKGELLHKGTAAKSYSHFVGNRFSENVYVTEGAIKGNLAHSITGKAFLCVSGVNNYNSLHTSFEKLKKNGVKRIIETYDMDKFQNKHVENARFKLLNIAKDYGFEVHSLVWDKQCKGIDDYLYSKRIEKLKIEI